MKCIKCNKPVSQEDMSARKEYLEKTYGIIARVLPMCNECRRDTNTRPLVVKRVG